MTRTIGNLCLGAGLLGAASGLYLTLVDPVVADDIFSYPLSADGFALIQIWFFVQHLPLLAGILALPRKGMWARRGVMVAAAGMALLAVTELWAITEAESTYPSSATDPLDASYGVASMLCALGLIVAGIAVLRDGPWTGWRRWVPLATGVWAIVPMTPMIMAGFVPARLGITGWMLLFAALGWALVRSPSDARRDVALTAS